MTRSIFAFTLACALIGAATARTAHADDKIAFVDLQRALEETNEGKTAKSRLKSDFDEKQEELKKAKEEFDKKSPLMKDDVRNKAAGELQQRFMQLQESFARVQQDLAGKEQEATRGILAKLSAVVGKIAEREKFAMVLERSSAVVWGQPSLDITNEVIRLYNQQGG